LVQHNFVFLTAEPGKLLIINDQELIS